MAVGRQEEAIKLRFGVPNLLRAVAIILSFVGTLRYGSASADDLYCPKLLAKDSDVASLLAFDAEDFCNALAEGFKIGNSTCDGGHVTDGSQWIIETTKDTLGYHNHYSLAMVGPSDKLGGYTSGGFEKYKMEVITFIGLNCKAAYYSVIYTSKFHTGSFSEAKDDASSNWKFFSLADTTPFRDKIMDYVGAYVRKKFK